MTAAKSGSSDRTSAWARGRGRARSSPVVARADASVPPEVVHRGGDIAQAGNAAALARRPRHSNRPWGSASTSEELTVNYRTPQPIADAAARVRARRRRPTPRAVRDGGRRSPVPGHRGQGRARTVVRCVGAELDALVGGLVGVVCPGRLIGAVGRALDRGVPGMVAAGMRSLDRRIMVLTRGDAKGLEFDSVVVVEPTSIAGDPAGGASTWP
ncbi:hypothetical protein QJS66_06185 [Kocuria rhizophila]|nr:hypothetical protein QJS66_06185 [Kocuria rhizophila]